MDVVLIATKKLKPYENNAKKHSKTQINDIANSLKRFGWQQPLVIDENNVIVIGHGRWLAAKQLGLAECECKYVGDLSEGEIKELRLADNKLNESPWDVEALKIDTANLAFEGFSFDTQDFTAQIDDIDDVLTESKPKSTKDTKLCHCPKCGFAFEV